MAPTGVVAISVIAIALLGNAALSHAYTNHTVGGTAGWFFDSTTNKTSADFTDWAKNQTFNLGDFLIFNSSTNESVIQTYNKTTYQSCSTDDAGNDTFQYTGGNNEFGVTTIIPLPLILEGTQYYFSNAQDGLQCFNGMAFQIKVSHGTGLPPSLNQPPPPPYASPPTPTTTTDDGQGIPVTNFLPNVGWSIGGKALWFNLMLVVLASLLA